MLGDKCPECEGEVNRDTDGNCACTECGYEYHEDNINVDGSQSGPMHADELCRWCNKELHLHGWVPTLEGGHNVCPGDWIITGVKGERYPCKPDIFKLTYDKVE